MNKTKYKNERGIKMELSRIIEENEKIFEYEKIKNILLNNKKIILGGRPGSGKTVLCKKIQNDISEVHIYDSEDSIEDTDNKIINFNTTEGLVATCQGKKLSEVLEDFCNQYNMSVTAILNKFDYIVIAVYGTNKFVTYNLKGIVS